MSSAARRPGRILALLLLGWLPAAGLAAQQQTPATAAVALPADWAERDLDGKWVAYRKDVQQHADQARHRANWARALREHGEFELLEQIALYEGWRYAGPELEAAQAPQLFRAALWNVNAYDSHNASGADNALLQRPAQALGWFERHRLTAGPGGGRRTQLYEKLQRTGVAAADPSPQLTPLDPITLLVPQLDAPATLTEFGERRTAEPKTVYVHQVLRALDGLLVWGQADAMHAHKVLALTRHKHPAVRAAAFTVLTKLPGALLPQDALLRMAMQEGEAEPRRLAVMALSFAWHPRALVALHEIAGDPLHPGADVACERLGEVGGPGSAEWLLDTAATATGQQRDRLTAAAAKIRARLARMQKQQVQAQVQFWVARVGWLRAQAHPRAAAFAASTTAMLKPHLADDSTRQLLQMTRSVVQQPPFAPDELAATLAAANAYAAELLGETAATGR